MERHAAADLDDLTAFLARLTGLLLRSSGEGAHLVEQAVADGARAFGGSVSLLLVPEAAALTVTAADGRTRTVTVHGFPEVFRLDQVAALKPLLARLRAGRIGIAEASRRLVTIVTALAVGLVVGGALTEGPGSTRTAVPPQDPGTSSASDEQGGTEALDGAAP
ncbi:hypothetical protein ABZT45_08890 [Streptomyces sp. NPDC005356]|uniref:threonine/serine exporter family protein n=1 Tax=Streptomyces sp. NPDC005356 TaxID=3157167 RepID=UPI0033B4E244